MKSLLNFLIIFIISISSSYASDVTWSDLSTGSTVTAAMLNEVKAAVNSKLEDTDIDTLAELNSIVGVTLIDATTIADSVAIGLDDGSNYNNFGTLSDDTINELISAIDTGLDSSLYKVKVDAAASAMYLYNGALGAIRAGSNISISDDGDYITISSTGGGGIDTNGTVNADEIAVFYDADTLKALTEAEFKSAYNIGAGTGDLLADGSVPLTANWDIGAYSITALRFISDQTTGTAPFTVASTTVVTNLNADLLDGESASAFEDADAAITKSDEAETITANWVNTANPWANNEVANTLTVTAQAGSTWDIADSVTIASVYSGTTSLEETTAANDSGSYLIGVFDEFTNSDSTNVQDVLDDLDAAISSGGETNTASSQGSGSSLYYQKSGVDLQFNAIKSESDDITISLDAGTHDIEVTFVPGNVALSEFTGAAANITLSDNGDLDETVYPIFADGATGSQGGETDTDFSYNPSTNILTVGSIVTAATSSPGFTAYDSDAPGSDKEIGKMYWNDDGTGGDGSEDADIFIQSMSAGTETTVIGFDHSASQIQLMANGEDLDIEFGTNSIDITTDTGVTEIDFIGITLKDDGVNLLTAAADTIDSDQYVDGSIDFEHLSAGAKFQSLVVADLGDTSSPHVLTTAETTNKVISNYASSGADRIFTLPAAHAAGNVIFPIGDEYQVDIEPDSGTNFYLNGTAMANDEHIQNTADTLGERIVGYCVNINGTLTWMFYSSDSNWVEETP